MNKTKNELDPETEFYLMFAEALRESGGLASPATVRRYAGMPFAEVVQIVAPNGLRMTLQRQGTVPVAVMEVVP